MLTYSRLHVPLKTHIDLLLPSLNSCLNRGLLRRERVGQVKLRFGYSSHRFF
jgi:hypothetical protein